MNNGMIRRMLDRATSTGRRIELWWRDDDAVRDGPELDRLLALSSRTGCPLALAVIPALIEPSLVRRLAREPGCTILAHGFRHANHAPHGSKPAEFGAHRPLAEMIAEATLARELVADTFGRRAVDIFVPPWNRVDSALARELPRIGFRAVSAFGRPAAVGSGVQWLDAHFDPVDWRGTRGLLAPDPLHAAIEAALATPGPIGLLSHHLVHDKFTWALWEELIELAAAHPAVTFRSTRELLGSAAESPASAFLELAS